jgi:hypothetical protein
MTFVLNSLYPKGNNDLKDERLSIFNISCCLVLQSGIVMPTFLLCPIDNIDRPVIVWLVVV